MTMPRRVVGNRLPTGGSELIPLSEITLQGDRGLPAPTMGYKINFGHRRNNSPGMNPSIPTPIKARSRALDVYHSNVIGTSEEEYVGQPI